MAINGALIRTEDGTSTFYKHSCKFNEGVDCSPFNRHCERCGWNPELAKARLEKFCNKRGIVLHLATKAEE